MKVLNDRKDIIYKVLKHEEVPRPAWLPLAGVHAGKLKGYKQKKFIRMGISYLKLLMEVNKIYNPDGEILLLICSWRPKFWDVN